MDKSYMFNSYVDDMEDKEKEKLDAEYDLSQFQFRIEGSKTIEELKHEIMFFLDKNDVPTNIKDGLINLCNEINENTDLYTAYNRVNDFMEDYYNKKQESYLESKEEVEKIKEDVISEVNKNLNSVGIYTTGNDDNLKGQIEDENDITRLRNNVESVTNYYSERNEILNETPTTEISVSELNSAISKPGDENLLNTVLVSENESIENTLSNTNPISVAEDGTIIVEGDASISDSTNFAAMVIDSLVVSKSDFNLNNSLDMKFIKEVNHQTKYKIILADFPLPDNPVIDPVLKSKIENLANQYNNKVSYLDILMKKCPELATSIIIIDEHILGQKGAFQMAVKNNASVLDMRFAMDENYHHIADSFQESGALVSQDAMEHDIVQVTEFNAGNQLLILSNTLESLREKRKDNQNELSQQVQLQKKYTFPSNFGGEAANINNTFLIVVVTANLLMLSLFIIFYFF